MKPPRWRSLHFFRRFKPVGEGGDPADSTTLDAVARAYPRFFSEHRFDKLSALFDPSGAIWVTSAGDPSHGPLSIRPFLERQKRLARNYPDMRETWDNVQINNLGHIGVVSAEYSLHVAGKIRKGVDVLILTKRQGGWRIVDLLFEEREVIASRSKLKREKSCGSE
jgi:hypothetical protein